MKIQQLCDVPGLIPEIANLYFEEWGRFNSKLKQSDIEANLQCYLKRDEIPLAVIAFENNSLVGVAQLKIRELSLYPQYKYWLGGVFVKPECRGTAVGSNIVEHASKLAKSLNVSELYLQTLRLDGGLYRQLGWQAVERFTHDGHSKLLMVYKFLSMK